MSRIKDTIFELSKVTKIVCTNINGNQSYQTK
jgi:hypothetical protein